MNYTRFGSFLFRQRLLFELLEKERTLGAQATIYPKAFIRRHDGVSARRLTIYPTCSFVEAMLFFPRSWQCGEPPMITMMILSNGNNAGWQLSMTATFIQGS